MKLCLRSASVLLLTLLISSLLVGCQQPGAPSTSPSSSPLLSSPTPSNALDEAIAGHASKVQVEGEGVVIKLLPDDREGDRHQRFIIRIPSGETLLIAHNIDEATRIDSLRQGDRITFSGEYEWNERGGVVHWTHSDRRGRHPAGWLRHNGVKYD